MKQFIYVDFVTGCKQVTIVEQDATEEDIERLEANGFEHVVTIQDAKAVNVCVGYTMIEE